MWLNAACRNEAGALCGAGPVACCIAGCKWWVIRNGGGEMCGMGMETVIFTLFSYNAYCGYFMKMGHFRTQLRHWQATALPLFYSKPVYFV